MARIPARPLFLTPGQYTVGIAGGADLGAMKIPRVDSCRRPPRWINRESSGMVRRLDGARLEWSVPNGYGALTVVANIDRRDGIAGFAVCQPPAGVSQFRVPPYALVNLPLTRRGPSDLSLGFAGVIGIPLRPPVVRTPGKESLSIYFVSLSGRSVIVQRRTHGGALPSTGNRDIVLTGGAADRNHHVLVSGRAFPAQAER